MDDSEFFKVSFFKDLPKPDLVQLVREIPLLEFGRGEYLFREGEKGDKVYVVRQGTLEVVLSAETPEEMLLRVCGPGESVGEMGLIMPQGRRTASVRVRDSARVWVLDREKFNDVMHRWPVMAFTLNEFLSERLNETNVTSHNELIEKNRALQQAYDELKAAQAQIVEKERLERELKVAFDIQLSILPDQLPEAGNYDFGACILPARQVGGDFYDVFPVSPVKMGILIGDVSDKGVPSALFMARTHALIMAEADIGVDVVEVMHLVNRHITRLEKSTQFVTALYGLLDLETGEFDYARAGHEPPLLMTSDGHVERLPHGPGMSLGMWDNIIVDRCSIKLPAGSTLLLYTDGMTDCRTPGGEAFGLERIKQTLCDLVGVPAQKVCDTLLDTLKNYQQGASQDDDVTLVAIHAK